MARARNERHNEYLYLTSNQLLQYPASGLGESRPETNTEVGRTARHEKNQQNAKFGSVAGLFSRRK